MVWQKKKSWRGQGQDRQQLNATPNDDHARRRSKSKIDSLNPTPNVLSRNAKIKSEVDDGDGDGDAILAN